VSKDILDSENLISDQSLYPLLIGFIFAFITGIFACKWMIKLVKNSKLKYFSYYCFIIGLTVIILS
jgi:undecaprenyl-diphosphatase